MRPKSLTLQEMRHMKDTVDIELIRLRADLQKMRPLERPAHIRNMDFRLPVFGRALLIIAACFAVLIASGCAGHQDNTKIAEEMVDAIAQGDYAKATSRFDAKLKTHLSEDRLRLMWRQLSDKSGAYIKRTGIRQKTISKHCVVYVTCQFRKMSWYMAIAVSAEGKIFDVEFYAHESTASIANIPVYIKRDRYIEHDITIDYHSWRLSGTLTLPRGKRPVPVVVMVPETSTKDRDESLGPNKPFKDIAWGLASQGIAVLRYDGLANKERDYKRIIAIKDKWTANDEITGVVHAAVMLCRTRQEIDPKHIYILGHGQGGYMIPRIGKDDPEIAGLILAAANTRPMEDVFLHEWTYRTRLIEPVMSDETIKLLTRVNKDITVIKGLKPSSDRTTKVLGAPVSYWLDLQGYDPAKMAMTLKQPILVLQSGRDYQATSVDNTKWNDTLRSKANVVIKSYPKLNHLLIPGDGQITPTEYGIRGNVSEQVIIDISNWIHKQQ